MRRPSAATDSIGAREAEQILGISRAALHRLAQSGRLPGRLIDRQGAGRKWRFQRRNVLLLKEKGTVLRRRPPLPKIRVAWQRAFGPIPSGFTVAARDRDASNTALENLSLVPLQSQLRRARRVSRRRGYRVIQWTPEQLRQLRREFATRPTEELAKEFGVSLQAVRCKARRLKLRKCRDYIVQRAREARALPIGSERIDNTCNIVLMKVSNEGSQYQQWRRKHHFIWEQFNGRPVPPDFRVIFKDGNKRNFDPANLELATKDEISAQAFARHLSYPDSLRTAIRMTAKLQREIERQREGRVEVPRSSRRRRSTSLRRWTKEMDKTLRRLYPTRPGSELIAALGVSLQSIRNRARRLGIRKSPEAIIAEAQAVAAIKKAQALAVQESR